MKERHEMADEIKYRVKEEEEEKRKRNTKKAHIGEYLVLPFNVIFQAEFLLIRYNISCP